MNNIPEYTLWAEVDEDLLEIEGLLAELTKMSEMAESEEKEDLQGNNKNQARVQAWQAMAEASFAIEGMGPDEAAEKVYRLLPELDPFSVDDIKKAHRLMMGNQLAGAGTFRREEAGIFEGEAMIYRAGAHEDILYRLEALLSWTRDAKEHPLIKSCVFHYEFEAIHPFADGNGRMGRLWQTLILGHWNPIFFRIPVDPIIQHHQEGYYGSLLESDQRGDCGPLVQFLCGAILEALQEKGEPRKKVRKIQRHTRLLEG
jgi:Uncharacterized conserved protein